jgi:hypothetical protein
LKTRKGGTEGRRERGKEGRQNLFKLAGYNGMVCSLKPSSPGQVRREEGKKREGRREGGREGGREGRREGGRR